MLSVINLKEVCKSHVYGLLWATTVNLNSNMICRIFLIPFVVVKAVKFITPPPPFYLFTRKKPILEQRASVISSCALLFDITSTDVLHWISPSHIRYKTNSCWIFLQRQLRQIYSQKQGKIFVENNNYFVFVTTIFKLCCFFLLIFHNFIFI